MKRIISLLVLIFAVLFQYSCTKGGSGTAADSLYSGSPGSPVTSGGSSSAPGGGGISGNPGGTPGQVTAGEWNDLDNWSFWSSVLQRDTIKTFPAIWGIYTQNRMTVQLRDNSGRMVHNARLTISSGNENLTAVTDNSGKAEFFPGLYNAGYTLPASFTLRADYQGQVFNLGQVSFVQDVISKTLPAAKTPSSVLDIMFVVDATGSMGDEISYLKTELADVVSRAGQQLPGTQIRMGSVFYRDHGDEYLTRPFPFTTNINQLTQFIQNQSAGGGGDTPEAVDEALAVAINQQQWSANAVNRLIFLVLDAPCHKSEEVLNRMRDDLTAARQKGIRIIPVSASGIDWKTEFLLRFMSVSTNSTYVFITNDSGLGNAHLTPTVGNYVVEYLNNLMVRLIAKYGQDRD